MTYLCCSCQHTYKRRKEGGVCPSCKSEDVFPQCPICKVGALDDDLRACSDENCSYTPG